jgi:3-oxoacyl-ACP reductase-like protein
MLFSPAQHDLNIQYHGGIDVSVPEGIYQWQRKVLTAITSNITAEVRNHNKGLSKAAREDLQQAERDT